MAEPPRLAVRALTIDAAFTLIEPTAPVPDVYLEEARRLGVRPDEAAFRRAFRARWAALRDAGGGDGRASDATELTMWRGFTTALTEDLAVLAPVHEAWHVALVARFAQAASWRPVPGAVELLERARAAGVAIAIVSNWHRALHGILAGGALAGRFDVCVTSADAGWKKPRPEIFHAALAALGHRAEDALHVGDAPREDVGGACAAGLRALLYDPDDRHPDVGDRVRHLDEIGFGG